MSSRHDGGRGPVSPSEPIDPATLAILLDHAYDAVAVRRFDGEILFWNRGAERTYGWTGGAGHRTGVAQPAADPLPEAAGGDRGDAERDGAWEGRLVHSCHDGRVITVDSRWALDTARGERVVVEISRDVTPRLEAEASARARERQLRFVTDSAPVMIAHCDRRTGSSSSTGHTPHASGCTRAI